MIKNNNKNSHLFCLDLIRVLIVFLILLFHINIHFQFETGVVLIDRFINQGAVVMTSFFMLSGFLLYLLYGNKNYDDISTCFQFYKKRFIKLYPLYIISVILFYVCFCLQSNIPLVVWGMQIVPLQAFFPNSFGVFWNGGVWFVSVIFVLYLCFPVLASILNKVKLNLVFLFLIPYLLCNYFCSIDAYYYSDTLVDFYISPVFRMFEFFAGMVIAKLYIKYKNKDFKYGSIYVVVATLLSILLISGLSHSNYLNHVRFSKSFLYYDVFFIPLFSIILFFSSKLNTGILYRISKSNVIQYLSKISYAFYLGQGFALGFFRVYLKTYFVSNFNIFIVNLILNIIFAVLMYEFIQKPFSKNIFNIISRFFKNGGR